ncbi:hypothetical protein EON77_13625 [bacterium]|nr:MAG: hypothetical protein EON77_13625 [bacterium]
MGRRGWAITAMVLVCGISLLYVWNPQKVDLFPRTAPPSPRITPEQVGLFTPGRRVAVVVAHPDDPEFYISGTLLRLKASGAKILIVLTTDGGKAYYPPFTTNVEENRRVRRQEQIDAAKVYGAEVAFLDEPDGRMVPDARVQDKVREALRAFDPEIVLTFDGDYPPTVQHRDHRNSGIAAEAVVGGTSTKWLLRFGTRAPNLWVDTSDSWDQRSELLAVHKSQFFGSKLPRIREMVYSRAEADGERGGFDLAEAFRATEVR